MRRTHVRRTSLVVLLCLFSLAGCSSADEGVAAPPATTPSPTAAGPSEPTVGSLDGRYTGQITRESIRDHVESLGVEEKKVDGVVEELVGEDDVNLPGSEFTLTIAGDGWLVSGPDDSEWISGTFVTEGEELVFVEKAEIDPTGANRLIATWQLSGPSLDLTFVRAEGDLADDFAPGVPNYVPWSTFLTSPTWTRT